MQIGIGIGPGFVPGKGSKGGSPAPVGLLNTTLGQNAHQAISFDMLNGAFVGSTALVVRRADNVQESFALTSDGVSVAEVDAFVGAQDAFIVWALDQSGNGFHYNQPSASEQMYIARVGVPQTRGGLLAGGGTEGFSYEVENSAAFLTSSELVKTLYVLDKQGSENFSILDRVMNIDDTGKWTSQIRLVALYSAYRTDSGSTFQLNDSGNGANGRFIFGSSNNLAVGSIRNYRNDTLESTVTGLDTGLLSDNTFQSTAFVSSVSFSDVTRYRGLFQETIKYTRDADLLAIIQNRKTRYGIS